MENIQLVHDDHHGELRRFPLSLLVHDMAAPENVGSLFRLADALGVEKLYLTGTTPLPPNRKIRIPPTRCTQTNPSRRCC